MILALQGEHKNISNYILVFYTQNIPEKKMLFIQFGFLNTKLFGTYSSTELGESTTLLLKHLVTCEQVWRYTANYTHFPYHNVTLSFVPNAREAGFESDKYVTK